MSFSGRSRCFFVKRLIDWRIKLNLIVDKFHRIFDDRAERKESPGDYYWRNEVYENDKFRHGHLQHYQGSPAEVLHVLAVPKSEDPIFGFDLVKIAGNYTLACGDLTPTVSNFTWDHPFTNNRDVPEWASFFSENVLFRRPEDPGDAYDIAGYFTGRLEKLLGGIEPSDSPEVRKAQNEYMNSQRQNEKTRKTLAADVGEKRADKYMREVLFPTISTP